MKQPKFYMCMANLQIQRGWTVGTQYIILLKKIQKLCSNNEDPAELHWQAGRLSETFNYTGEFAANGQQHDGWVAVGHPWKPGQPKPKPLLIMQKSGTVGEKRQRCLAPPAPSMPDLPIQWATHLP